MKNILLLMHGDAGQESRLQAALDVGRALDAHISCIDVAAIPRAVGGDYFGEAQAVLVADELAREETNRTVFEARIAKEDVSWDWTDVTGDLADAVVENANLADLVVLNRQLSGIAYPDMFHVTSEVLVNARTPVLAVPDTLESLSLRRALVAWDGGASAANALRACVPLLAQAAEVLIVTVQDGKASADPEDPARYLSRHGIHATVRLVQAGGAAPDAAITAEAERWGADYVLMGAYSRGRMREIFGGVTKRMLATSELPLVLGH